MSQGSQPGLFHEVANANNGIQTQASPEDKTTTSAGSEATVPPGSNQPIGGGDDDSSDDDSTDDRTISFSDFLDDGERVFTLNPPQVTFFWNISDNAELTKVSWVTWESSKEPKALRAKREDGAAVEPTELIASDFSGDEFDNSNARVLEGKPDGSGYSVMVNFGLARTNLPEVPEDTWMEKVSAIRVDWQQGDDDDHFSWSPFFSVTDSTEAETSDQLAVDVSEWETKLDCRDGCDDPTEANEAAGDVSGDDADEDDGDSGSGGSSGLAAGAIAGIVVGAVAGLAIIGLLVWFALRRRRKNARPGLAGGRQTSDAFIADKAEQTNNADSPRSPYSDDGNNPRHLSSPAGTAAGLAATSTHHGSIADEESRPKFTSYHDTRSIDGASNGHQTPQGVSRNVAHLVEDGMTDADIRRLEEEERALDDAIERAGRR